MKLWPFKKTVVKEQKTGAFDSLVLGANMLAKVSLVPFFDHFPLYRPIVESELMEVWDRLMTIAMSGVAAQAEDRLSDLSDLKELKKALEKKCDGGAVGFEDYYEYTMLRTKQTGAPWTAVSAMWVADNLRLHSKANVALKNNANQLDFVNALSAFMNMSFGSTDVGLFHFLGNMDMALDVEKMMSTDFGLLTKEAKKDSLKKLTILVVTFEQFARKTVEMIAEDRK